MRRGLNTLQGYEQHRAEHFAVISWIFLTNVIAEITVTISIDILSIDALLFSIKSRRRWWKRAKQKSTEYGGRWNVFQISRAAFAVV